jgi:hypothetical protein
LERGNFFAALKKVRELELITVAQTDLIQELRNIRNRAAHEPDYKAPLDDTLAYIDLASSVVRHLEVAAQRAAGGVVPG